MARKAQQVEAPPRGDTAALVRGLLERGEMDVDEAAGKLGVSQKQVRGALDALRKRHGLKIENVRPKVFRLEERPRPRKRAK